MLAEKFKMKDLGKLKHFLGIDFSQSDGCVKMSQERYTNKILQRFNMQDCRTRETPCEQKLEYTDDAVKMEDVRMYREAVGSLIYLTTCTRPDLSFVVSRLSQYFAEPTEEQWVTVKHVLRNFKGPPEKGLSFRRNDSEKLGIQAYSDADWAADTSDRRSTTGYCVSLSQNSSLVSWKTRKQPTVVLVVFGLRPGQECVCVCVFVCVGFLMFPAASSNIQPQCFCWQANTAGKSSC